MSHVAKEYTAGDLTRRSEAYDRERARATAVHEAAHAVALFLIGRGDDIIYISVATNDQARGHVRAEGITGFTIAMAKGWRAFAAADPGNTAAMSPWTRVRQAIHRDMLFELMGPAAGMRVSGDHDAGSRLADVIGGDMDACFGHPDRCGCDAHSAMRAAVAIASPRRSDWWHLLKACNWADELLDVPRVWATVTALADRLPFGAELPSDDARRVMADAWGSERSSWTSLGAKWRGRFGRPPLD